MFERMGFLFNWADLVRWTWPVQEGNFKWKNQVGFNSCYDNSKSGSEKGKVYLEHLVGYGSIHLYRVLFSRSVLSGLILMAWIKSWKLKVRRLQVEEFLQSGFDKLWPQFINSSWTLAFISFHAPVPFSFCQVLILERRKIRFSDVALIWTLNVNICLSPAC